LSFICQSIAFLFFRRFFSFNCLFVDHFPHKLFAHSWSVQWAQLSELTCCLCLSCLRSVSHFLITCKVQNGAFFKILEGNFKSKKLFSVLLRKWKSPNHTIFNPGRVKLHLLLFLSKNTKEISFYKFFTRIRGLG